MSKTHVFKSIDWVVFLILCVFAIFLTWEVLQKFWAKDSSMKRLNSPIEKTPAIGICFSPISVNFTYGKDFNISRYFVYNDYKEDQERKWVINKDEMNEIVTSFAGKCYKIPSSKVNGRVNQIITVNFNKENVNEVPNIKFYITSDDNFSGIFFSHWMLGEVLDFEVQQNHFIGADLKEEQYIYLEETNDCLMGVDVFKCFEQKLASTNFHGCPRKCLPYTTQNQVLPMCNIQNSYEFDCARLHAFFYLLNNVTSTKADGCKPDCRITQYSGRITYQEKSDTMAFRYSYSAPEMITIHEEYLLYDNVGLISAIGGTLGIFIGFSISHTFSTFLHYLQVMISKIVKYRPRWHPNKDNSNVGIV